MCKCKELEARINEREELLQEIYQMWRPLWEKAGLDEDHPLFQALMDRIQEIPNDHDGKMLQEVLQIKNIQYNTNSVIEDYQLMQRDKYGD